MQFNPFLRRACALLPLLTGASSIAHAQSAAPASPPKPAKSLPATTAPAHHPRLGVYFNQRATVTAIQPNSPGARAGFKVGDILKEFNHHQGTTVTWDQFLNMIESAPAQTSATVIRSGKLVHLTINFSNPTNSLPATPVLRSQPVPSRPPAATAPINASSVSAKPGYIVGKVVKADGSPLAQFKIHYSGYEKGKFVMQDAHIGSLPNISGVVDGSGGHFAIKVPNGLYDSNAWVEVNYHGKAYKLPLYPEPRKYDYPNQHLQALQGGLVHNYVWKISGLRGSLESQPPVPNNWYGGLIDADCDAVIHGTGENSLVFSEPAGSQVEMTLVPQGPLIDGSQGKTIVQTFKLGMSGYVKDVPLGYYLATARVIEPNGTSKPLKISLTPPSYNAAQGKVNIAWQQAALILFGPSTVEYSTTDPMGADRASICLGEADAAG